MQAIDFPESNKMIAENQHDYITLPAHMAQDGCMTSFWRPTFREKISILFGGIWLQVLTYNYPLQPLKMTAVKPKLEKV